MTREGLLTKDTTMKGLLTVTAALEAATGLALLVRPSLPVALLLGSSLESPAGSIVARMTGAALLSLGVACWRARDGATGMISAMLLYNVATVAILTPAGLGERPSGIALWPVVVIHTAMAAWCALSLRAGKRRPSNTGP
jgi:hypothetical protein